MMTVSWTTYCTTAAEKRRKSTMMVRNTENQEFIEMEKTK